MDFKLNEEQAMIQAAVRDFARKEIAPVTRDNSRNEHFPLDLVKRAAELGLLGLNLPAEYGGGGSDYVAYCVMCEEIARADVGMAAAVSVHLSLAGKSILNWGSEEQKQRYLPRLASGEILGCLASTEPNVGSDVASMETMAKRDGDSWVINGNKMWITNGSVAGISVVIAQTDKSLGAKGLTAFLVEAGTPGFSTEDIHHKFGMRTSNTAELIFEDCRIPAENVLAKVGKGMAVALSAFESARLGVSSRSVGAAQACLDASIDYALDRKQFGKQIGSFQMVQEMLAEMAVQTQAARLLVYHAASLKDSGENAAIAISMAKYFASEIAFKVANNAMQIHGSYGYTDEYPVERFLRDVRVSSILEGTSQVQKLIIGRSLTGLNAF